MIQNYTMLAMVAALTCNYEAQEAILTTVPHTALYIQDGGPVLELHWTFVGRGDRPTSNMRRSFEVKWSLDEDSMIFVVREWDSPEGDEKSSSFPFAPESTQLKVWVTSLIYHSYIWPFNPLSPPHQGQRQLYDACRQAFEYLSPH